MDCNNLKNDRARAADDNFRPLDGKFDSNVMIQVKNGPIDFQVREPVSPLFGTLEKIERRAGASNYARVFWPGETHRVSRADVERGFGFRSTWTRKEAGQGNRRRVE